MAKQIYKRSESFFSGEGGVRLYFQSWEHPDAERSMIITHGQGEHSECYHRLVEAMADQKCNFYAWDLRGHGRSDGRRGVVQNFDEYCQDYKIFLDLIYPTLLKAPLFLFAHSMGGLIQLKNLIRNPDLKYSAALFSSPLLGLALPVPAYKTAAAGLLKNWLPQVTLGNEIKNDMLTRDPAVIREFEQDALRHNRISSGAFLGFLESFEYVRPRANDLKKPILFLLAENDPVVSTPDNKIFFEKIGSPQKEVFIYPGAKHELVNDTVRSTVFTDLKHYMSKFTESPL